MTCLICQQTSQIQLNLTDILFLRCKQSFICQNCQQSFQKIDQNACLTCCSVSDEDSCKDCLEWKKRGYKVDHRSLYRYNSAMKAYFSQYKFQGDYLLRKVFAQELAEMIQKNYRGFTPVPVPVSKERYQERGFNQVTAILDAGNISYVNLFKRLDTDRQSSKNKKERLLSERHYQLIVNEEIPEKIVIVDDIYTTGSTIITLKKALEKVGNTVIKSLSIAR